MKSSEIIISHLTEDFTEPVRDPLWQNIYLSPELMKIIDTPQFQKLKGIKQLGPTCHVYPGATHTRFLHSLGVFHCAKRLLTKLLFHPAGSFDLEEVKAFLAACLLHDIGHFPYAHSLKELPLKQHETLTAEIIVESPIKDILKDSVGTDPLMVAAIVDTESAGGGLSAGGFPGLELFRNLLSGVLDPDKLDYLNRDAYFCGVPYGVQDIDFIFDRISLIDGRKPALLLSGAAAVEHLLFSKYLMYKNVYWHKTVRIATAMVKKAVFHALCSGELNPEDLYGKDDAEFMALMKESRISGRNILRQVEERRYYKLIYETPFNPENAFHVSLTNLHTRAGLELDIAGPGGKADAPPAPVIIDIPEPVSFEVDIPLLDDSGGTHSFHEGVSVFSEGLISGFRRALRTIRVLAYPGLPPERMTSAIRERFDHDN